jgi:hypothetical protein
MFIDPNFETLSGEFLVRELSAYADARRLAPRANPVRRLWRWAVRTLKGRRVGARSRGD